MCALIKPMVKSDFTLLEPLLRASHGPTFDLQDELDYFDLMPHHSWFYLTQNQEPKGFIRCFEIEPKLYQIELYVNPSETLIVECETLIHYFLAYNQLGNARIRFEVEESKVQLLELLDKCFPNRDIKRFLHMEKHLSAQTGKVNCDQTDDFYFKIANILGVLKIYTPDYLQDLYEKQQLYAYCDPDPLSALHIEEKSEKVCEIVTIATDVTRLRCGCAEKLLHGFFAEAYPRFNRVQLKVDETNVPAIRLYQKTGFEIVREYTQHWWYVDVSA